MVYHINSALSVELIALAVGTGLLLFAGKDNICCKGFAKFVAYLTIIVSILMFICTSYHTVRHWGCGHGMNSCPMHKDKMHNMMHGDSETKEAPQDKSGD